MSDNSDTHINYTRTFVVLLVALVVSLILSETISGPLMVTTIFVIAAFKAYLVLTRFMHLSIEPVYIRLGAPCLVLLLLVLFVGLYPDIVLTFGGESGQ
jgi:caa(3)-type oxidase subunit IV